MCPWLCNTFVSAAFPAVPKIYATYIGRSAPVGNVTRKPGPQGAWECSVLEDSPTWACRRAFAPELLSGYRYRILTLLLISKPEPPAKPRRRLPRRS